MQKGLYVLLFVTGIVAVVLIGAVPGYMVGRSGERSESVEIRLRRLEDREEIRKLLRTYGQLLDKKDFEGFSRLFSEKDGEWIGGMGKARGSAAIRILMEKSIGSKTEASAPPNCHIFANDIIDVNGNRAEALSRWIFVVQDDASRPQMLLMGQYEDVLIREGGRWKFLRRTVS